MKKIKFFQRKFIVNKPLQYIVLLHSLSMAFWISLINVIFGVLVLGKWGQQNRNFLTIMLPLGMIIIVGSTVLYSIVLSNRIAGPIYRLKRHMEEIAEGAASTTDDMNIRKADFFSEILMPYNKVIAKLYEFQKKTQK